MDGTSGASQAAVQDEKGADAIAATDTPVETFEQGCLGFGPWREGYPASCVMSAPLCSGNDRRLGGG